MSKSTAQYVDPVSAETYPLAVPRWRSAQGRPLMITRLPGIGRNEIDRGTRSLWRYAAALPVAVSEPVSLGEGCTPLVRRRWQGVSALFKLEWFAPTGSLRRGLHPRPASRAWYDCSHAENHTQGALET